MTTPAHTRAQATMAPAEHAPARSVAADRRRNAPLRRAHTGARSYWWSWGEPISAVADVLVAARKVAAVLKVLAMSPGSRPMAAQEAYFAIASHLTIKPLGGAALPAT